MNNVFSDITIVVVIAAVLGTIARLLRQPTIVAYIVTGVFVGILGVFGQGTGDVLHALATFGVTLLLFLVGLEMRLDNFRAVGKAALFAALLQIGVTAVVGLLFSYLMGFSTITALYISASLTFSSTIVVVKLLSQKRELQTLHGRITVGFLILQDVMAIFTLIFLASIRGAGESLQLGPFLVTLIKSAVLFALVYWLSQRFFPWLFEKLARSPELLFITSIAWAFGVSRLVASEFVGLSVEIGGFLAGIALAKSIEQYQIESQLRPLRDFFIVLFFVVLGSSLVIDNFNGILLPALLLTGFVLVLKPLIILAIMGVLGFRRKTSFYTAVSLSQISEFSLILMAMGLTLGHVREHDISVITLTGVSTIIVSTYLIQHQYAIFSRMKKVLRFFERRVIQEEISVAPSTRGPVVLVGAHRLSGPLLQSIEKQKLVIVEFDPVIAKELIARQYKVVFGDITDVEIQEFAHVKDAYVCISTIPDLDDNLLLLERLREMRLQDKKSPVVIVTAYANWEAKKLYEAGADYVILPHYLGGMHLAALLRTGKLDTVMMENWKKHDQRMLHGSIAG